MDQPEAEFAVICIDNASKAFWSKPLFTAQIEATKFYCDKIIECNPKSMVSLITMSSLGFRRPIARTSDLKEVHSALQDVRCQSRGETSFEEGLAFALDFFSKSPSDMKKRLLMFVGGTNDLNFDTAREYGMKLKHGGVALDVFNFFLLKMERGFKNPTILTKEYHYARLQLHELYTAANANNNSLIDDVVVDNAIVDYKSFLRDTLSEYILEKHLRYLKEKAAADEEKKTDADDEKSKRSAADGKSIRSVGVVGSIEEFTIICIDNAWRAYLSKSIYDAQIEGTKLYCKSVFERNPMNKVGIITMSSEGFRLLVKPTRKLSRLMRALEDVSCQVDGDTRFVDALSLACSLFSETPFKRKRLLMFVQGFLSLEPHEALSFGKELQGVALDVINFFKLVDDGSINLAPKIRSRYHYARRELDMLVTAVNDNKGIARIEDVLVKHESSVIAYISKHILKTHLHLHYQMDSHFRVSPGERRLKERKK